MTSFDTIFPDTPPNSMINDEEQLDLYRNEFQKIVNMSKFLFKRMVCGTSEANIFALQYFHCIPKIYYVGKTRLLFKLPLHYFKPHMVDAHFSSPNRMSLRAMVLDEDDQKLRFATFSEFVFPSKKKLTIRDIRYRSKLGQRNLYIDVQILASPKPNDVIKSSTSPIEVLPQQCSRNFNWNMVREKSSTIKHELEVVSEEDMEFLCPSLDECIDKMVKVVHYNSLESMTDTSSSQYVINVMQ